MPPRRRRPRRRPPLDGAGSDSDGPPPLVAESSDSDGPPPIEEADSDSDSDGPCTPAARGPPTRRRRSPLPIDLDDVFGFVDPKPALRKVVGNNSS